MDNSQLLNLKNRQIPQSALGKMALKVPAEVVKEKHSQPETKAADNPLKWSYVKDKNGEIKIEATPNTAQVDVTSISIYAEEVKARKDINVVGYKVDLNAKIEEFEDKYAKNHILSKSHNLMVGRFAAAKTAFYGALLSTLGVSHAELKGIQKKATGGAIQQNKLLFAENEYNGEILMTCGSGSKKQMSSQARVISEIRDQLIIQARNLGIPEHYDVEKVMEIRMEQCGKILNKFKEEKNNLEYQLNYYGVNKNG